VNNNNNDNGEEERRKKILFSIFHVGKREIIYISRKGSKIEHTFCATR